MKKSRENRKEKKKEKKREKEERKGKKIENCPLKTMGNKGKTGRVV